MSIATLSPTGPEVAALRHGIQVMMSRQAADPTSWIYQANIHGTYDSPASPVWNQCQHGSFFFFAWHRMYLYYFERILRAASGDPNLALPYWNYTDSTQRALPIAFRQPSDPSTNPLYVQARADGINDGIAQLPDSAVSFAGAFTYVNFSSETGSGLSFGGQIESGPVHFAFPHGRLESQPHDVVHVLLGGPVTDANCPDGWMADPNCAARDPIFWLHHANIDRLWKRWLDQGGGRQDPVSDSVWMNTPSQFFDENGQPVQVSGHDILNTVTQLNYRYDDDPIAIAGLMPVRSLVAGAAESRHVPERLAASAGVPGSRIELATTPVTVSIPLQEAVRVRLNAAVAPTANRTIVLNVEDIQYDNPPGVYYEIYINLPKDEKPDYRSVSYVGNLGFFALKPHAVSDHEHGGPAAKVATLSYDATKVIRELMARNSWKEGETSVTFVMRGLVGPQGQQLPVKAELTHEHMAAAKRLFEFVGPAALIMEEALSRLYRTLQPRGFLQRNMADEVRARTLIEVWAYLSALMVSIAEKWSARPQPSYLQAIITLLEGMMLDAQRINYRPEYTAYRLRIREGRSSLGVPDPTLFGPMYGLHQEFHARRGYGVVSVPQVCPLTRRVGPEREQSGN